MYLDEAGAKAHAHSLQGRRPDAHRPDRRPGRLRRPLALPSVQQHLKSGALRAIGVAAAQRTPAAPEIPTIVEQGLPGYVVEAWFARASAPRA